MKNKILKTFLFFILFSTLLITASFAVEIKEYVADYESDVYIIGSTRFDANQTITATMAANAGINEAKVQVALNKDISNLKVTIYFYDAIFGDWYEINKEAKADLIEDTTTIKNIEDNLNIFYEEGVEKTLEVKYEGDVDKASLPSNVNYKDGKFLVPATTFNFTFEDSKGVETKVNTNVDTNIKEGKEPTIEDVDIIPEWAAMQVNGKYYAADEIEEALANSTLANPLQLYKVNHELTGTLTIKSGNALVVPEDLTLTAKAGSKIVVEKGASFVVKGKFEFIDGATVDGNVTLKGGRWETNMYKMAGPDNSKYITTDAVFTMKSTNYDLTITSGSVSLGEDHRTLQGQTIVVAKDAEFTIPTGKTLQVYSKVVIEEGGTVLINGNLDLQTGATLDGNITVKGGNVISEGTRITGKDDCAYETQDAVYRMYENGDITILSGDIVLTEAFATMPEQKLVLCKGTTFTIPEKIGFYVYSDLTVEEGATMTVKGNLKLQEGSKFTVKGTLEFIDGATIDGDVALKGGKWITNMYNMAGPEGCKFITTDAVFTMKPTNYDMVVASGEVALGENHRTFPVQNIVVAKEAKFTVPAGMTLQVYSTVTIEEGASVVVAGTLSIEQGGSITGKYTVTETGLVARQVDDDDSLKYALEHAKEGDTINLAAGNYSKVLIDYRKKIAKNITLVGTDGVNVAGVNMNGANYGFVPEDLTLKNITFTDDVIVHNTDKWGSTCKNLSIIECTFSNAAFYAGNYSTIDGITIKDNKFNGTNTNKTTSILLIGEHTNVLIEGNIIEGSSHNAVQCTSVSGKTTIVGNTMKNIGSRAIRITTATGADLTISNNIISNVNTNPTEAEENMGQVIKITGKVISTTAEGNTYNGEVLNIIDGIASCTTEG